MLNIVYHLFNRYGSSKKHTKGSNEYEFYERWRICSTQFLEDHMAIAIRLMQASVCILLQINHHLSKLFHKGADDTTWQLS